MQDEDVGNSAASACGIYSAVSYDSGDRGGGDASEGDTCACLTLPDYINATYNALMKSGWRMKDIDEMDMVGFLLLRAWDTQREKVARAPKRGFIDQVWPQPRK
ncbi:MAG: hypothetical protein RR296_13070 [Clostridia bacterium]